MLDRLVDRMPALLLLLVLAFSAHVAIFDAKENARLVSVIPAVVLLVLYMRVGGGAGGGKGGRKKAAATGGNEG